MTFWSWIVKWYHYDFELLDASAAIPGGTRPTLEFVWGIDPPPEILNAIFFLLC